MYIYVNSVRGNKVRDEETNEFMSKINRRGGKGAADELPCTPSLEVWPCRSFFFLNALLVEEAERCVDVAMGNSAAVWSKWSMKKVLREKLQHTSPHFASLSLCVFLGACVKWPKQNKSYMNFTAYINSQTAPRKTRIRANKSKKAFREANPNIVSRHNCQHMRHEERYVRRKERRSGNHHKNLSQPPQPPTADQKVKGKSMVYPVDPACFPEQGTETECKSSSYASIKR